MGIKLQIIGDDPGSAIERADLIINDAWLVGEMLGLDVDALDSLMNNVDLAYRDLRRAFPDHDFGGPKIEPEFYDPMRRQLHVILNGLKAAIDTKGAPVGEAGERLRASSSVTANVDDGSLKIEGKHMRLAELRDELAELLRAMDSAAERGAMIQFAGW